jgi:hypothetical protein
MNTENENDKKNESAGSGKCTKCGCQSFRGDSDNPEKCVNIRVPTRELCGHTKAQHK